ncbi:MAG: hypothetical protein ACREK6_01190 [Candidatus Rokuibacteriota bacterium]
MPPRDLRGGLAQGAAEEAHLGVSERAVEPPGDPVGHFRQARDGERLESRS